MRSIVVSTAHLALVELVHALVDLVHHSEGRVGHVLGGKVESKGRADTWHSLIWVVQVGHGNAYVKGLPCHLDSSSSAHTTTFP